MELLRGVRLTSDIAEHATCKEQKALEKKIPWSMIPPDQRPCSLKAPRVKIGDMKEYEAARALGREDSQYKNSILATRVSVPPKQGLSLPLAPHES